VALVMHHAGVSAARARDLLIKHKGSLRAIIGDLGEGGDRGKRAAPADTGETREET
jgi:hypothetical protein